MVTSDGTEAKKRRKFDFFEDAKLDLWQWVGVILLVIVLSGFVGWAWEFILAEIQGGLKNFYITGGNLLPWMNIYAYGAILILLTCYRLRKRPWLVFLTGALTTGILELFSGWLVYTLYDGARYWDYSTSWIGIGHINGFVCPASVIVFGLGAVLLIYQLLPRCINLAHQMSKKAFLTLSISLFTIILIDDSINLALKNLDMPTAQDFYLSLGWIFL
ncbi:putative ABC transporter permease [Candidatus Saccharibacteria bacterium]|nr:putative ABC transporter permease [Candidatus Saccharibacteria bacterium]MBR6964891.1 putative ABC transporter permease [Candidatus Saccharibacteria bacterium]